MSHTNPTRRDFLLWGGIVVGTPLTLVACQTLRNAPTERASSSPPAPTSAGVTASDAIAPPRPFMPDLTPPRVEPHIRVRVARRNSGEAVAVGAPGPGRWVRVARADGPVLLVLAAPLRATVDANGWTLIDGSGVRHPLEDPASASGSGHGAIEIGALRGEAPTVSIDGTEYFGVARLIRREDGGIDSINVCPMESYLPGVLARELYADWRLDTYTAQAIAARSFACTEMAFWRDRRHFDVVAGQASQAYIGRTGHASSLRAVAETRGGVLTWEGRLVPGYYSSSCGGVSASAIDAISDHPINGIPPLAARPPMECCRWAPTWRWSADRPSTDAARRISAWAASRSDTSVPALREITRIEATAVNAHGRPVRYRVQDRSGTAVEIRSEQLRHALNHAGGSLSTPKDPIRSGHFTTTSAGATLRVAGRGFGHGAGLCQYGAEGMARRGVRYAQIIDTYYVGAKVVAPYR